MLIKCPICGERDREEFTYFGDATIQFPPLDGNEEDWFKAVYHRENPAGEHEEFWQHSGGCRAFIKVRRNTVTHEISACELVGPFADKEGAS